MKKVYPLNFIVNTMPKEALPQPKPNENDRLAYGAYLINAAGCMDCHSKTDKGSIIKGSEFGGGMEFQNWLVLFVLRISHLIKKQVLDIGQNRRLYSVSKYMQTAATNRQNI